MHVRQTVSLVFGIACLTSIGCCGCMRNGCGYGGQVYSDCCQSCDCCESSCCCPEASCCCPEASCCCPEASCCCPDSCCTAVGCGSPVIGQCQLLHRIKNALCGCCGCGSQRYYGDCCSSLPCDCDCNSGDGSYQATPGGRRPTLASRQMRLNRALEFSDEGETTYR